MSWNVILLARGRRYSTAATCGSVYQDAMSPSTFLVAYLTLLSLSVVPTIAFFCFLPRWYHLGQSVSASFLHIALPQASSPD